MAIKQLRFTSTLICGLQNQGVGAFVLPSAMARKTDIPSYYGESVRLCCKRQDIFPLCCVTLGQRDITISPLARLMFDPLAVIFRDVG